MPRRGKREPSFAERCRAMAAFEDRTVSDFVLERAEEIVEETRALDPLEPVRALTLEVLTLHAWHEHGAPPRASHLAAVRRTYTAAEVAILCDELATRVRREIARDSR